MSLLDELGFETDNDSRTIYLHSDIVEEVITDTIRTIENINKKDLELEQELLLKHGVTEFKRQPIYIDIMSDGGLVQAGFALVSVIEQSKTPIITRVQGYAYSFGVILFLAAPQRELGKYARLMVHQLGGGVEGTLQEIEDMVDESQRIQDLLDSYILERTSLKKATLKRIKAYKKDYYMDAQEALRNGFATKII